jgi:hypothetical protein
LGGTIGGMSIESIDGFGYEVIITSNKGVSMLENTSIELTATLYQNGNEYTPKKGEEVKYRWYSLDSSVSITEPSSNQKYVVDAVKFNPSGFIQYGCEITVSKGG